MTLVLPVEMVRGMLDALRFVQAEQTPVNLACDGVSIEQIVKEPLQTQPRNSHFENARVERTEVPWLINGNEEVFHPERSQIQVTRLGLPPRLTRIVGDVRIPEYVAPVNDPSHTPHLSRVYQAMPIQPSPQTQLDVQRVDPELKHGKILVVLLLHGQRRQLFITKWRHDFITCIKGRNVVI